MTLIADEQLQEWQKEHEVIDRPNTIGCAAIDANGILVAGTSTGRITGQPRGRKRSRGGSTAIATLTQRRGWLHPPRPSRTSRWAHTSDMAVAYMTAEMDKPAVFTKKEAESG
ncbi:MAG TPA: hypothetical protein VK211_26200 [Kamptonema sp.]|nr:hypothetical protein [Kamptonema sp.]